MTNEELERMVSEVCLKLGSCSERQANIINEALTTVRDSIAQLPSEEEINEEVANGFDWAFDHLKTTVPLAYEYGLRAGISWLRSRIEGKK